MRNLKKFLALVLAMMMVFGLMVTANATSVDDYTDGDEVSEDFRQAMEVITALGILQGDGTSLYPQGKLQRSHLAAVLYRVGTGNTGDKEDDDVILQFMKDADTYKDVPAGHWATGYINYVTDKQWLNGYGSNSFGPDDTLTVVQMLSGVLRMMGKTPTSTGNWEMDTLKAADALGLIEDFTAAQLTGDATREMVAQIALNAMTYVDPNSKTGMYRVDLTADGKSEFSDKPVFLALDKAQFESRAEAVLNVFMIEPEAELTKHYTITEVYTNNTSLGYKNFSLSKASYDSANGRDAYGRPMTVYMKGNTIISELPETPVFDQNTPITGIELYNELGPDAVITRAPLASAASSYDGTPATRFTVSNGRVDNTPYGGNGVSVEIYEIDDDEYRAVVIAPVFAQIENIKSVRKSATEGAHTQYFVKGVTLANELKVYSSKVTSKDVTNVTINGTVEEDDYVIIDTIKEYNSKHEVVTSYVITPVKTITGVVSRYVSSSNSFTIGGRSYPASAIPGNDVASLMNVVEDGESHTIALDDDNNVVAVVDGATVITGNYIFALHDQKIIKIDGNIGTDSYMVTGIDRNGNLVSIEVSEIDDTDATGLLIDDSDTTSAGDDTARGLYKYTRNTDGSYNLTYASSAGSTKVYYTLDTGDEAGDKDFTINGKATLTDGLYATSSTKYYVAVKAAGKYTGVTTYTGVTAIGDINANLSGVAIAAIDANGDGIAEIVFIDSYTETIDAYAYVLDDYTKENDGLYYYEAYYNGGWGTLKLSEEIDDVELPALVKVTASGVTKLDADDDEDATILTMNADTWSYTDGLLIRRNTSNVASVYAVDVSKDVPVYICSGGDVTKTTAEKLKNDGGAVMVFVRDGIEDSGKIVAIYIDEDAQGYGEIPADADMTAIKNLPDGVYTVNASNDKISDVADASTILVIKYTAIVKDDYVLSVYNAGGNRVFKSDEISKDANVAGVFYINVVNPLGNAGSGTLSSTWSGVSSTPAGTYTFEIVGESSGRVTFSGSFTK